MIQSTKLGSLRSVDTTPAPSYGLIETQPLIQGARFNAILIAWNFRSR